MIRSRLQLRIVGLNQGKLLSLITSVGIKIWELQKPSYNEMLFVIYRKDYKKFLSKIDSSCYNVTIEKKFGLAEYLLHNWYRCGLLFGLFFSVYLIALVSTSIWSVEYHIDGDIEKISSQASVALEELGIGVGSKKKAVDPRKIEKILQAKMPSASLVVVEQNGAQLIISIKEATEPVLDYHKNIISQFDGIIESIEVASGIVRVDVGDVVTKGQILIEAGMTGDIFSEANGKVLGRIFVAGDAIGTLSQTKLIRSGNSQKLSTISIFGKNIGKPKVPNFVYYEAENLETYIAPNMLLPIKKVNIVYHELIEVVDIVSLEELIETLKAQSYQKAKNSFPPNEQELNVRYSIVNEGEYVRVVCTIETTTTISIKE